jgi:hypothetical protein
MDAVAEPGVGLRLSLKEHRPTAVFPGGPSLWARECQALIRDWSPASLGRFLPYAVVDLEDESSVLFILSDNDGEEVASQSYPIGTHTVASEEFDDLLTGIELLRRRARSGEIEDEKRKIIEAFELPDPKLDTFFYRVYGPRRRRKLLILWGCERRIGSGTRNVERVSAIEAVAYLRDKNAQRKSFRTLAALAAALILACLAAFTACKVFDLPFCSQVQRELVAILNAGSNLIGGKERNAGTRAENAPDGGTRTSVQPGGAPSGNGNTSVSGQIGQAPASNLPQTMPSSGSPAGSAAAPAGQLGQAPVGTSSQTMSSGGSTAGSGTGPTGQFGQASAGTSSQTIPANGLPAGSGTSPTGQLGQAPAGTWSQPMPSGGTPNGSGTTTTPGPPGQTPSAPSRQPQPLGSANGSTIPQGKPGQLNASTSSQTTPTGGPPASSAAVPASGQSGQAPNLSQQPRAGSARNGYGTTSRPGRLAQAPADTSSQPTPSVGSPNGGSLPASSKSGQAPAANSLQPRAAGARNGDHTTSPPGRLAQAPADTSSQPTPSDGPPNVAGMTPAPGPLSQIPVGTALRQPRSAGGGTTAPSHNGQVLPSSASQQGPPGIPPNDNRTSPAGAQLNRAPAGTTSKSASAGRPPRGSGTPLAPGQSTQAPAGTTSQQVRSNGSDPDPARQLGHHHMGASSPSVDATNRSGEIRQTGPLAQTSTNVLSQQPPKSGAPNEGNATATRRPREESSPPKSELNQPEAIRVSSASQFQPEIVSQEFMTDGKVRIVMKAIQKNGSASPSRNFRWAISNANASGGQVAFTLQPRGEVYKLEFSSDEKNDIDVYSLKVDVSPNAKIEPR